MITIVDYGMGNVGSIENMIKKAGGNAHITSDRQELQLARKLILPGVGAFDHGMKQLQELDLIEILSRKVLEEGTPILGICLGMQLMSNKSQEGLLPGLGWVDAETIKFSFNDNKLKLKIPHMGWNVVSLKKESPLFTGMYDEPSFYFVHSFHVRCCNDSDVLTTTNYGFDFCSSFQHKNIFATQFHPEKSHKYGLKIIHNFLNLV